MISRLQDLAHFRIFLLTPMLKITKCHKSCNFWHVSKIFITLHSFMTPLFIIKFGLDWITRGPWTLALCLTAAVGITLAIFCRLVSKVNCCRLNQLNLGLTINSDTVPHYAFINYRPYSKSSGSKASKSE